MIVVAMTVYRKTLKELEYFDEWEAASKKIGFEFILIINGVKNFHAPENSKFITNQKNLGTRGTVLTCLELYTGANGFVFIDQDTSCSLKYIQELIKRVENKAIFLPRIFSGDSQISPSSLSEYGRIIPYENDQNITGIMTMTYWPRDFLKQVQIPKFFWLDYLDHYLFFVARRQRVQIVIQDGNFDISHDLSVQDFSRLSLRRFINISIAEYIFSIKVYPLNCLRVIPRLTYRICKYLLKKSYF